MPQDFFFFLIGSEGVSLYGGNCVQKDEFTKTRLDAVTAKNPFHNLKRIFLMIGISNNHKIEYLISVDEETNCYENEVD
ncbi:MAG: hypothetical protein K2X48_02100 [Chitinophagaceae bacterium]|nr:hypothetical protein [Chitinophagaceae bacterium]